MTTATPTAAPTTATPEFRISWPWLAIWATITAFALNEIAEHGFSVGAQLNGFLLAAVAFGFFVLPDLTFLIGVGQPAEKGHLQPRAVPFYNFMHRMPVAASFTALVGIASPPLDSLTLTLVVGGLSWMAHIALDRAFGYDLRNADGSRR